MEQSRATSHFLSRNIEASVLRERLGLVAGRRQGIMVTSCEAGPASQHSLNLSVLSGLLLSSAKVQQGIQLRLQKSCLQPLHVLLQGVGLEVLHHPPH